MARQVWVAEVEGGADVPPGVIGVYTSQRRLGFALRGWAGLTPGSRAIRWQRSEDHDGAMRLSYSAICPDHARSDHVATDKCDGIGEAFYLSAKRWALR